MKTSGKGEKSTSGRENSVDMVLGVNASIWSFGRIERDSPWGTIVEYDCGMRVSRARECRKLKGAL